MGDTRAARHRRSRMLVVALASTLTLPFSVLVSVSGASADKDAGQPANDDLRPEEQAAAANEGLWPTFELLSGEPGFESGGFAGDGSGALEFYWHGDPGPEARTIIAEAEADGREVRVVNVPYSYQEMFDYSMQIAAIADEAGVELSGFGTNRQHTAIEVMGPVIAQAEDERDRLRQAIRESTFPQDIEIVFLTDPGTNVATFNAHRDDPRRER